MFIISPIQPVTTITFSNETDCLFWYFQIFVSELLFTSIYDLYTNVMSSKFLFNRELSLELVPFFNLLLTLWNNQRVCCVKYSRVYWISCFSWPLYFCHMEGCGFRRYRWSTGLPKLSHCGRIIPYIVVCVCKMPKWIFDWYSTHI